MDKEFDVVMVHGKLHGMATQRMAAVQTSDIGDVVSDLSACRDEIVAATDFLFQGF